MNDLTAFRAVCFTSFIISIATFGFAAIALADARESRIPGQYIVVFKDGVENVDQVESDLLGKAYGERIASYRTVLDGFAARMSAAQLAAVKSDPRVAFVSEDRVVRAVGIPRIEASFPTLTLRGITPRAQVLPTGVDRINAENKTNTGIGAQVAVIDTGIYLSHADLKANIVGGKNCASKNANDYGDQNGHGTHVAGTIAAINNTQGVVGVAPGAKLWSVRVLDRFGYGTWSSVICGLDFVAGKGVGNGGPISVANMSLGGGGSSDDDCGNTNGDALHKAVCRVRDAGVVLVVAAGNDGTNTSGFVPAAYDDAVITVSALVDTDGAGGGAGSGTPYGTDDTFASFSNYGSAVDIGAPGVNINSTWKGGGYKSISGTSMASPHVAGAAALYIATHASSTWTGVRDALVASGEAIGSGHTDPSGNHPEPVLRADSL